MTPSVIITLCQVSFSLKIIGRCEWTSLEAASVLAEAGPVTQFGTNPGTQAAPWRMLLDHSVPIYRPGPCFCTVCSFITQLWCPKQTALTSTRAGWGWGCRTQNLWNPVGHWLRKARASWPELWGREQEKKAVSEQRVKQTRKWRESEQINSSPWSCWIRKIKNIN